MNFLRSLFTSSPRAETAGHRIDAAMEGIADTLEHVNAGLKVQFGLSGSLPDGRGSDRSATALADKPTEDDQPAKRGRKNS